MLKSKMINSIQSNIKDYEKLLKALEMSNLTDKEKRIEQCKYAIKRQKKMMSNIEKWEDN